MCAKTWGMATVRFRGISPSGKSETTDRMAQDPEDHRLLGQVSQGAILWDYLAATTYRVARGHTET
jgi:hypothetical protein